MSLNDLTLSGSGITGPVQALEQQCSRTHNFWLRPNEKVIDSKNGRSRCEDQFELSITSWFGRSQKLLCVHTRVPETEITTPYSWLRVL